MANSIRNTSALTILSSLILLALLFSGTPAHAWWIKSHQICTLAAVKILPDDVPQFFRSASDELAEMSSEPDNWKNPTTPHLRATEQPEHYIDLEYLQGKPMPEQRSELLKIYQASGVEPSKGGFLPHAILENYERLLLAFREYRGQPDSVAAQHRILVHAGWLAHYCADSGMPLHTTKLYDGKSENGEMKQKGIHARIDGYPEKNNFTPEMLAEGAKAEAALNVWPTIVKAIQASHTHVDECYALDLQGAFDKEPEKGKALMLERARASAKLIADIWYSAWINSAPEKATIKAEDK